MTPRNTQLGASASALRAPSVRVPRAASPRASGTSRTKHPTRTAAPKAGRKPAAARAREATAHRWWLLPVIIIAVVSLFVAVYYPVARVQYRETRERTRLQAELDAIRARNDRLRAEVARLKTPEGVEDYARVQLGLVKKGEHQVVVVDGTEPTQTLLAQGGPHIDSQEAVKPPVGQWTAFLDAIFGVQ
jgi:cell division protein FtsL